LHIAFDGRDAGDAGVRDFRHDGRTGTIEKALENARRIGERELFSGCDAGWGAKPAEIRRGVESVSIMAASIPICRRMIRKKSDRLEGGCRPSLLGFGLPVGFAFDNHRKQFSSQEIQVPLRATRAVYNRKGRCFGRWLIRHDAYHRFGGAFRSSH
jgi:hypothetical protein